MARLCGTDQCPAVYDLAGTVRTPNGSGTKYDGLAKYAELYGAEQCPNGETRLRTPHGLGTESVSLSIIVNNRPTLTSVQPVNSPSDPMSSSLGFTPFGHNRQ